MLTTSPPLLTQTQQLGTAKGAWPATHRPGHGIKEHRSEGHGLQDQTPQVVVADADGFNGTPQPVLMVNGG